MTPTQPMPTTQSTMMLPTTTTPANTATTANTMPSDHARSTVTAPTHPKPQQPPQTTSDTLHAADDNSPAMIPTMMPQLMATTTAHNATTEKTTTGETPTTASTFHQSQQLLQRTDDKDIIGDNLQTMPPTMTPPEQTPANNKTTEKTLLVDPFTLRKTLLMTQSTADISNNAEDEISPTQPTTMLPTTTMMPTNTETTVKTTIDDAQATASPPNKPQSLPQLTDNTADDTEVNPLMPLPMTSLPMPLKQTRNDEMNKNTTLRIPDRSTTTDNILSNHPPLMTPIVAFTDETEHKFELTTPMTPPTPTFPTLPPDYLSSDYQTTHLSTTTINWVRDSFAPVFKAMHRLEIEIVKLTRNVFAVTSNINTIYPPMPPTPNQQPHCHQPKFLCPSTYK